MKRKIKEVLAVEKPGKVVEKVDEDKRQKFVRLATFRVNKAIKAIYGIAKLSARSSYSYEEPDIVHITAALTNAVESTVLRFKGHKNLSEAFQISVEKEKAL